MSVGKIVVLPGAMVGVTAGVVACAIAGNRRSEAGFQIGSGNVRVRNDRAAGVRHRPRKARASAGLRVAIRTEHHHGDQQGCRAAANRE